MTRNLTLFDIDGVLADDRHRLPFALEKDWENYFDPERMSNDTVLEEGRALMEAAVARGDDIGYLSTRRDDLRPVCENWLWGHGFAWGPLFLRPMENKTPAANYKAEVCNRLVTLNLFGEVILFEDDPEIVRFVNETTAATATQITYYVKHTALVKTPTL